MNRPIYVLALILAASDFSSSDICLDILNNPDRQYSLDEVNRCHECGWYSVGDDIRTEPIVSSNPSSGPAFSRLDDTDSSWCAVYNNNYLQIEFPQPTKLGGFEISGFKGNWVEQLKIYYETEEGQIYFAKNEDGLETFHGNDDDTARVKQKFGLPIFAKTIRVIPVAKHGAACLRIDIFSCEDTTSRTMPGANIASDAPSVCKLNPRTDCGDQKCAVYKTDIAGCQICECNMTTGGVFEMDISLNEPTLYIAQARLTNADQPDGTYSAGARSAARFQDYKEGNNYIVYYDTSAVRFSAAEQRQFQSAISHIAAKSCIRLKPNTRRYPYYLKFVRGGGCSSPVGKIRSGNQVSIGYGCGHTGIIVHEIMHSLGFWHEQSRPDRDSYVTINWGNIPSGVQYNFQKQGTSKINSFNSPYDYNSLMHYSSTAFSSNGRQTITPKRSGISLGQRNGLSTEDAKQLNAMYGCTKVTGGTTTTARPIVTKPGGSCTDKNNRCKSWADRGECKKNPGYMLVNCKKSCKECGTSTITPTTSKRTTTRKPTGSCVDENRNCRAWARVGECTENPRYMLVKCKKSCNRCAQQQCDDKNPYCPSWKTYCDGRQYPSVLRMCQKTCNLC